MCLEKYFRRRKLNEEKPEARSTGSCVHVCMWCGDGGGLEVHFGVGKAD